jgi:hypothetical protein
MGIYGTNEGDIWSGEDSPVGKMLLERDGLVMIHEMMVRDGELQELIYNVAENTSDPDLQDLIKRAREGVEKYQDAQATLN